jgi:hypothetical protein
VTKIGFGVLDILFFVFFVGGAFRHSSQIIGFSVWTSLKIVVVK